MRATQHRGCCVGQSGRRCVSSARFNLHVPFEISGRNLECFGPQQATLEACWGWGWGWLPLYAGKVGCVDGHLEDPARPSSPPPGECL